MPDVYLADPTTDPRPSADPDAAPVDSAAARGDAPTTWRRVLASRRVTGGGALLLGVLLLSLATLPWTARQNGPIAFNDQKTEIAYSPPGSNGLFGTDQLGRSSLGRCLMGGSVSLGIGVAAAAIATVVGVFVGLVAGYRGGWVDSLLMRVVDILYGLPYILLILLFKTALEEPMSK